VNKRRRETDDTNGIKSSAELCLLRISLLAFRVSSQSNTSPPRWPHLQQWQLSNRQQHWPPRTLFSARLLPMLNTPNRSPRPKTSHIQWALPTSGTTPSPTRSTVELILPAGRHLSFDHFEGGVQHQFYVPPAVQMDLVAFKDDYYVGRLVQLIYLDVRC